jgi:hypothetical protein
VYFMQLLPIAQRLLDDLLSAQQTEINTYCGAPGKHQLLLLELNFT